MKDPNATCDDTSEQLSSSDTMTNNAKIPCIDDSTTKAKAFIAPTPLLSQLERDLTATSKSSNKKRSIRECLRSKASPCPEVKKIITSNFMINNGRINRQDLRISYNFILTKYLSPIKSYISIAERNIGNQHNKQLQEKHESINVLLSHISRLGTVMRFIQLLLEYQEENEPDEPTDGKQDESRKPVYVTPSMISDAEINKIILQLIRSVTGVICSCCERKQASIVDCKDDDCGDDASSDDNSECNIDLYNGEITGKVNEIQLAFYALGSLLQINNGYVRSRPFLLAPLWKGFCDIIVSVKHHTAAVIPVEIISDSIKSLTEHLTDGVKHTTFQLNQLLQNRGPEKTVVSSDDEQKITAFQMKVISFLIARISFLFSLVPKDSVRAMASYKETFEILFQMNGLVMAIDDGTGGANKDMTESTTNALVAENHPSFLNPYRQLALKSERCLLAWIGISSPSNRNSDGDDEDNSTSRMIHSRINRLLSINNATTATSEYSKITEIDHLSVQAFALGKVSILIKILELFQGTKDCHSPVWVLEDVEIILLICENLLFTSLPLMYSSMKDNVQLQSSIMDRSIRIISVILLTCEMASSCIASNIFPGRNKFHRLLVHWLQPRRQQGQVGLMESDFDVPILSQELITTILCIHVLSLYRIDADCSTSKNAIAFLKLLVALLFDVRSTSSFRRSLSGLITRLRKSKGQVAVDVQHLITYHTREFELRHQPSNRKKGQKRKRHNPDAKGAYTARDIEIITAALMAHPNVAICTTGMDINSKDERPVRKEALTLLAIQTSRRSDFNSDDLQAIKIFCKVWNRSRQLRGKSDDTYWNLLTVLGKAVSQLTRSVCICKGRSLPDKAMDRVCTLIKFCTENDMFESNMGDGRAPLFLPLVYEAIDILAIVGTNLGPSNVSQSHVQTCAHIFHRLFSCEYWSVQAYAMTAFVHFVSTMPSIHKEVIPACLPSTAQTLLQCRLQKTTANCTSRVPRSYYRMPTDLIFPASSHDNPAQRRKIFPIAKSLYIAPGSYFMTMPTQEGRSAIVVFPPNDSSLDDINVMLGLDNTNDDESNMSDEGTKPMIQILRSSNVTQDGGCKIVLQQLD